MALTLEQYACEYLPTRKLPWPAAPAVEPVKARPHLAPLNVKCVLWTAYGTLLAVPHGELRFDHEQQFITDIALRKTLEEFKMWQSMTRTPGQPEELLREMYKKAYSTLKLTGSGEVVAERVWEEIVKKLQAKDYKYDVATYGPMPEFLKKVAYFYHASIQGCGAYPNAAEAVRAVMDSGRVNGLLADGQSFTPTQIHKALQEQDGSFNVNIAFPAGLRTLSTEVKVPKPNDAMFKAAMASLAARKIAPGDTLVVGSSITRDIAPAKKHGFKTALYAGDKHSLAATGAQLKEPSEKPDCLLTDLAQLVEIL